MITTGRDVRLKPWQAPIAQSWIARLIAAPMASFGLLHPVGVLVTEPLGGLPVSFDTLAEARASLEPGLTIVRLIEDPRALGGIRFAPLDDLPDTDRA